MGPGARKGRALRLLRNRAIAIDPNDAEAYNNRGFAYAELGEFTKAIADYDRAIDIDPDDAFAYYYRAFMHAALDNTFKARADMRKYRELGGK